MRSRFLVTLAVVLVAATFVVDALTPQTLVIAILLDIPIVLAAFTQSRRLTSSTVGLAIAVDVLAAFINASHEGRWSPIGLANRALTILSLVLVGMLSTALLERTQQNTVLAARDQRRKRDAALAAAGERMRQTLSRELVARAMVREALPLFDAASLRWYAHNGGDTLLADRDGRLDTPADAVAPVIASVMQRTLDERSVLCFAASDPVARLLLEEMRAPHVITIPVADQMAVFGVIFIAGNFCVDEDIRSLAAAFGDIASSAFAQSRLFEQLASRNDALSEREEIIRDLVYALSHDLRTPLAALALTLRQARDGAYGEFAPEYREVLAASLGSIDDLRRLAETLLLVARIEAGEYRAENESVNLKALCHDVVAEFEAMAKQRAITLTVNGGAAQVAGDRAGLRRALVNLVANALQYTPDGGSVDLVCGFDGPQVRIDVMDNGFGVASDYVPYLFQRFSGDRAGSGSGLGLYLVRRIAEQHGGRAFYAPRDQQGSVFSITISEAVRAHE